MLVKLTSDSRYHPRQIRLHMLLTHHQIHNQLDLDLATDRMLPLGAPQLADVDTAAAAESGCVSIILGLSSQSATKQQGGRYYHRRRWREVCIISVSVSVTLV